MTKPSYEERRITKHSGSLKSADSASGSESSRTAKEIRKNRATYKCDECGEDKLFNAMGSFHVRTGSGNCAPEAQGCTARRPEDKGVVMLDIFKLRLLIQDANPEEHQHVGSCAICVQKFKAERELLAQMGEIVDELVRQQQDAASVRRALLLEQNRTDALMAAMREIAATDDGIGGIIAEDIVGKNDPQK